MSTFSVSDGDPGRKGIDIIMVDNFDVLHALADEPTSCPECRGWGISTVAEACSSCGGRGCVNCSDGAVPVEKPCGLCGGRGEIPPREWLEMMGDSLG
jgi:RecJ-like exonuclease